MHVGFIFEEKPENSPWAAAHDEGRLALERSLADAVVTTPYYCIGGNYDDMINKAIADGSANGSSI